MSTLTYDDTRTIDDQTITLDNSQTELLSDDTTGQGATLTLGANLIIDQTGSSDAITSTSFPNDEIVNNGTINADAAGGSFYIEPENFDNQGSLNVSNGDTLYVQPAGSFINLSGTTLSGGTYDIGAGSTLALAPNQTIQTLNANVTLDGVGSSLESENTTTRKEVQLDDKLTAIGAAGTLNVLDQRVFNDATTVTDAGSLNLSNAVFHTIGVDVTSTGTVTGNGISTFYANIQNNGVVTAQSGTLAFYGNVTGSGSFVISPNSALDFGGNSNAAVTFTGYNGHLVLESPESFSGTIAGFQNGDSIELVNQQAVGVTNNGDSITVTLEFGGTETFKLAAPTTGFTTVSDGHGGSMIVICFMPGTAIATPNGERAIETLALGDLVTTHDGAAAPIMWIGRQTVSTRFGNARRVLPTRIKAHALGESLPHRDLLVSPDHALLVDGVLIQAAALINGTTIIRETDVPEIFTYYHVELADHSLILAENIPVETFVDNVDRLNFDNWEEHLALYPEGCAIGEMEYPRAKAARQIPLSIKHRLAAQAPVPLGKVPVAA